MEGPKKREAELLDARRLNGRARGWEFGRKGLGPLEPVTRLRSMGEGEPTKEEGRLRSRDTEGNATGTADGFILEASAWCKVISTLKIFYNVRFLLWEMVFASHSQAAQVKQVANVPDV